MIPESVWFHGTNRRYLEEELAKERKIGGLDELQTGWYGRDKGIYIGTNGAAFALGKAVSQARSEPVLLVGATKMITGGTTMGSTFCMMHGGAHESRFITLDVVLDPQELRGFHVQGNQERIATLLREQTLFEVPPGFDYATITTHNGRYRTSNKNNINSSQKLSS